MGATNPSLHPKLPSPKEKNVAKCPMTSGFEVPSNSIGWFVEDYWLGWLGDVSLRHFNILDCWLALYGGLLTSRARKCKLPVMGSWFSFTQLYQHQLAGRSTLHRRLSHFSIGNLPTRRPACNSPPQLRKFKRLCPFWSMLWAATWNHQKTTIDASIFEPYCAYLKALLYCHLYQPS